ncbi:MAG TPA: GNAT family N-acetyltransferase [Methanospirillum sp.]|jgi:GNAT superfamily N-acetyltransferase|uniref:GNAT family N-acetyltransferase n=1 Tax=Methanospirillum sp. TaxID=45200 RepID=UPI001BD43B55|nr:GNAT family N-acetyltransferase [Methanospirillum sp.]HPY59444.1 GNAT family N-acetyltransferase [Methanospirillum sp.]
MAALEQGGFHGCDVLVERVHDCRLDDLRALFHAGDWWEGEWDDSVLCGIVNKSFAFVAAIGPDGRWIGMGRIISDGVSDAYLQDIVVLPEWREKGIGTRIVEKLLSICRDAGIGWIGIIAAPETSYFYRRSGFAKMNGYTPMRYEVPVHR